MKKIYIVFLFLLICSIIFIVHITKNNKPHKNDTNDDLSWLSPGQTASGFHSYDTKKIVNLGDQYEVTDDCLRGMISFAQDFEDTRHYALIIFIDFIQYEFKVDNKPYIIYPFELTGKYEIEINVEIPVNIKSSHEFSYFIINEPHLKDSSLENEELIRNMLSTRGSHSNRILINNNDYIFNEKYDENNMIFDSEIKSFSLLLTKTYQDVRLLPIVTSGEMIDVVFTNMYSEEMTYVFVALSNGIQTAFPDGSIRKIIKIPPKANITFPVIVPEVENEETYQVLAFVLPLSKNMEYRPVVANTYISIIVPK